MSPKPADSGGALIADARGIALAVLVEDGRLLLAAGAELQALESAIDWRGEQLRLLLELCLLPELCLLLEPCQGGMAPHSDAQGSAAAARSCALGLAAELRQLGANTEQLTAEMKRLRLRVLQESKKAEQELRLLLSLLEGAMEAPSGRIIDRMI